MGEVIFCQNSWDYRMMGLEMAYDDREFLMPRYNIALLPAEIHLQATFAELAQQNFGGIADEYCLNGRDALAHVTLCQFAAATDEIAQHCFNSLRKDVPSFDLALTEFHARAGKNEHKAHLFLEFQVERSPELFECQNRVFDSVLHHMLVPHTKKETYSPHITLARIRADRASPISMIAPPIRGRIAFLPALGLSSSFGVYQHSLASRGQ